MDRDQIRSIVMLLIVVGLLLAQSVYASIDRIIAFGDSLSDNGNLYALTARIHRIIPYVPFIPSDPYFQGRFSNGPVWIEQVAKTLNVPLDDYAYGGAWVEPVTDSKQIIPFSLGMQVNFYLTEAVTDFHKENHLYVIWAGANDYVENRSDPDYATTNTVATIQSQIEWLIYYGAKNVLVINMPDISIVPEVVAKGPVYAAEISHLIQLHNMKVAAMMVKMKQTYPDVKFVAVDVKNYYDDIMNHPDKYLLKNIKDACYTGDYSLRNAFAQGELSAAKKANIDILNNASLRTAYFTSLSALSNKEHCQEPDTYLFWDHIHPSRVVHQIISIWALSELSTQFRD